MNMLRSFIRSVIALLPRRTQRWLFGSYWTRRSPDRRFLVSDVLPAFARFGGTILWVGCRDYTRAYPSILQKNGGVCWTMDIDPNMERWGNAEHHVTISLLDIEHSFNGVTFNSILCNGIFGFGVDTLAQQEQALHAMYQKLKPGGYLLLSWNTDRSQDPLRSLPLLHALFEPAAPEGLRTHYTFPGSTHIYEFLRKRTGS